MEEAMPWNNEENRRQMSFLPPSLDDLLPLDHPARAIDAMVEKLDCFEESEPTAPGRPEYNPKSMIKIFTYAYSRGIRTSRKIEQACCENLAFIWLSGRQTPCFKTICNFRRKYGELLRKALKSQVKVLMREGLIDPREVFVDGSRILADVSKEKTITRENLLRDEKLLDDLIEELLDHAEQEDRDDDDQFGDGDTPYRMEPELVERVAKQAELIRKKRDIFETDSSCDKVNMTDPDCRFMRHSGGHGRQLSYNGQVAVEGRNGFVIGAIMSNNSYDGNDLHDVLEEVKGNTGNEIERVVADAGYYSIGNCKSLVKSGIQVVIPPQENRRKQFHRDQFRYDSKRDAYICPEGRDLEFRKKANDNGILAKVYNCKPSVCSGCALRSQCLNPRNTLKYTGRIIRVRCDQQYADQVRQTYQANRDIYKRRFHLCETVFAYTKTVAKLRRLLLRGMEAVQSEWILMALAFNTNKWNNLRKATRIP
jgi:transposase